MGTPTRRVLLWTCAFMVGAVALAILVSGHQTPSPAVAPGGAPVSPGASEPAPVLAPEPSWHASPAGAARGEPGPARSFVARGVVVRRDPDGVASPVGAGTRVFSFAGERAERIAVTETDATGEFVLREDLSSPEARARGARARGLAAESREGSACSYPVFLALEEARGRLGEAPRVRLVLRPGAIVRGRLIDTRGEPVAFGECFARWSLPPGAHVQEEDESGAAAPRHEVLATDEQGGFEVIVPPGLLQLRGRRGRLGGLGPRVELEVRTAEPVGPVTLLAGAASADVRFRVLAPDGAPIPSAFAMLRSADILYVVASPALDRRDVGAVFADASGLLSIGGVAVDAPPFVVGFGAPGYLAQRREVHPQRQGEDAEPVVLRPKLTVVCALVAPDGTVVRDLPAAWDVRAAGAEETGAARSMARSDDVVALVEERVPGTECERDDASGGWRLQVPAPGRYEVSARVEGLAPIRRTLEIEASGSRCALPLPPGRSVALRAVFPDDPAFGAYEWHLSVVGGTSEGAEASHRPLVFVPRWEPTNEKPDLAVWCPGEVRLLRVGPSTRVDLPVQPIDVLVPPTGTAPCPVRLSGLGAGVLEVRYEEPRGTACPGVELEILSATGDDSVLASGIRWVRTGERGSAALAVPVGEYFVGRARHLGEPRWDRVRVTGGDPTRVVLAR